MFNLTYQVEIFYGSVTYSIYLRMYLGRYLVWITTITPIGKEKKKDQKITRSGGKVGQSAIRQSDRMNVGELATASTAGITVNGSTLWVYQQRACFSIRPERDNRPPPVPQCLHSLLPGPPRAPRHAGRHARPPRRSRGYTRCVCVCVCVAPVGREIVYICR